MQLENHRMDSKLQQFFEQERKWFFEPDAGFSRRVMARVRARQLQANGFWDSVLAARRPVFGFALTLLLLLVGIHFIAPLEPSRGLIAAYLDAEATPVESLLYSETEIPSHEIIEKLMVLEDSE